jgi:protein O-mannosyl-transferase
VSVGSRPVLFVAVVCVLVNLGALNPGFIHDDHRIIEQNGLTADLRHVPEIFRSGYWSIGEVQVPNLYRPVTILSFAIDRTVHDLRPLGFRLVDLLLHTLNALLVFLLAQRLLPRTGSGNGAALEGPLLAALLFAVHPVHTEVLGEIVGRAELLAAAFALGSVLVFLRARDAAGAGRGVPLGAWPGALCLTLFGLAFLSKENAVVVPGLLLLADLWVVRRRPAWGFHLASCAVLASLFALRFAVLGGLNPAGPIHFIDNPIAHLPFVQGRSTALAVLARYVLLLAWPAHLSIDYSFRSIPSATGPLDAGALAGAACVLVWAALVARTWRRAPGAAFALGFAGLAFSPVANLLVPIGTIMAERLLYLPSAGICIALAATLAWGRDRPPAPGDRAPGSTTPLRSRAAARAFAVSCAAGLVVAALSVRSVVRLRDWRDDYTIFKAALEVAPENVRALFNFGAACEERGDDASAVEAYEKAIAVWPDFADAHYNLAGVLARQKDLPAAVDHYREALSQEPGNVQYLVNLAHTLTALGRHTEAREVLRRAIGIDPSSSLAYTDLGAVELAAGDTQAAIAAYREAVRLEPANALYMRNLGVAQHQAHDPGAAATFRGALLVHPGDPELLDALGLALLDAGDPEGAVASIRQAVATRPEHPVYHYHLARGLELSGDLQGAAAQYREAIRLAPSVPFPLKGLGLLLARLGDRQGALEALERASALDPKGSVMDETARSLLDSLRRGSGGVNRPR